MKKFLFLLIVAVATMQAFAANVDRFAAQAKAEAFLKAHAVNGKMMSSGPINFKSVRTVNNSSNVAVAAYHVFNTDDMFVIVSGDDRTEEILGYGEGTLDLDKIPSNMRYWLSLYQKQIEYLQARPGMVVEVQSKLQSPRRAQNVSPLLRAKWDQTSPYYNECVINGTQYVTGCPATSLAQVFYYWKYPTGPTGTIPAYRFRSGYSWVNVPSLPSITFDWANMKDSYAYSSTSTQKTAVAKLMRYIGQVEHMEYGTNGSGISSDSTVLITNACKFFGYDSNVRNIKKTNYYGSYTYYTDAQWAALIQAELEAGHPIVYCAISDEGSGGGHAFNVDGYTVSTNKYHINWGWSGYGNGDFALNAFTDYDGMTFDIYQQMVIGIQPPGGVVTFPVLTVEPQSLDFGTVNVGNSTTRTFTVSGINILGDVTFTRGGNAAFSVSPESLTAEQVAAGATVTVTYAPTTASNSQTGTITVASPGAESITVSLTGASTATPVLTADPASLTFTSTVGNPVTDVFTLTGYNLSGAVYLAVVNSTGGFSINKSSVTKAAAANGVEVTVTYKPTSLGNHTAQVMLRSKDADTIYVNLNGTAEFTKETPVMLPANEQYITTTSFLAEWTDATAAAGVSGYTLEYGTAGDIHTINNITNKNYLLEELIAGATYSYKVKALYVDNTESAWSNIQYVTLPEEPAFEIGDVNLDGRVSIADVTALINILLGGEDWPLTADVDQNGSVTIKDVTDLIEILLSGGGGE